MDLHNFAITDTGQKISIAVGETSYEIPIIILTGTMVDDNNDLLADYTGANALVFPAFLSAIPFQSDDSISLYKLLQATGEDLLKLKYLLEHS